MPLIKKIEQPYFTYAIWEVKEPMVFFEQELALTATKKSQLEQNYTNEAARINWMSSRYLLQQLTKKPYTALERTAAGKLILPHTNQHISISHSGNWIAVIVAHQAVGIDIQIPTPKLKKIASKYIGGERLKLLQIESQFYEDYLHYYWGIKEALFKAYGLGQIDYRQYLKIEHFPFSEVGSTKALVCKSDFEGKYQVFYQKTKDYYLCISLNIE